MKAFTFALALLSFCATITGVALFAIGSAIDPHDQSQKHMTELSVCWRTWGVRMTMGGSAGIIWAIALKLWA